MSDLLTTHASEVTEDQIDHLGHMNVRYYAENASAGTRAMLDALPGWGRRPFIVHDVYTRHHREQLLATALIVRSAVLGADIDGLRLHHELAARDTGVLAATFVHRVSPLDEGGERAPLSDRLAAAAQDLALPAPLPYAATRTISLDADLVGSSPSLELVRARELAVRRERLVTAEECDAAGRYTPEMAPMLVWGGEPVRPTPVRGSRRCPAASSWDGPRWRPASRPAGCRGSANGCRASAPPSPSTTRSPIAPTGASASRTASCSSASRS